MKSLKNISFTISFILFDVQNIKAFAVTLYAFIK